MIQIPFENVISPNINEEEVKEKFKKICIGSRNPDKLLEGMMDIYEAYKFTGQNTLEAFSNTLRDYIKTIPK